MKPQHEQQRREVAEQDVLDHVEDEQLLGARLERRRERDREEQHGAREGRDPPVGTGVPRRASVRARTPYITAATSGRASCTTRRV